MNLPETAALVNSIRVVESVLWIVKVLVSNLFVEISLRVIEVTGEASLNEPAPLIFTTISVTSVCGAPDILALPMNGDR